MKKIVMPLIAFVCGLVVMPKAYAADVANKEDFIREIGNGGEVKLTADITDLSETIDITKDVVIDLGGKKVTSTGNRAFNVKNGTVTIKNGTIENKNASSNGAIIYVYGSDTKEGANKVNLTLDKTLTLSGISGVVVSSTNNSGKTFGATVNVDCTINNTVKQTGVVTTALTIHGTLKESDVVVNVNGSLTGVDAGIYQAGASAINLKSGALVTGKSGVVTKAGTLNVTGAKVSGTGALVEPAVPSGDGFTPTGAGIQIESNKNYAGNIDVNVNGGSVTSENNSAIQEYLESETEETSVKEISVKGNAALTSAKEKEVVSASESFNETNKEFIEKGTTLSGATNKIASYLKSGLEIDDKGKVVDPEEEKANVTTNDKTNKADKNPATGDTILAFILLLGLGLVGTVTTAHTLRKSE